MVIPYTKKCLSVFEFLLNTGNDCENETNSCLSDPCSVGRNCTDLSPEAEVVLGRGYNCSDCPPGYTTIGLVCVGK